MGGTSILRCPKCGNTVELYQGKGMMWHTFTKDMFYPPKKDDFGLNFYDELGNDTIKKIQEFIEQSSATTVVDAYYQPYICKNCGKIESRIYFRIENPETGKTCKPHYLCECGGKLKKLTQKEQSNVYCNKCQSKMINEYELLWD